MKKVAGAASAMRLLHARSSSVSGIVTSGLEQRCGLAVFEQGAGTTEKLEAEIVLR